jgi:hypothetical protein
VGDGGWWIEERGERSAGYRITEWQNGGMAEWQKGGMVEWYFTTYLIYPAIFMVHADDADGADDTDGF